MEAINEFLVQRNNKNHFKQWRTAQQIGLQKKEILLAMQRGKPQICHSNRRCLGKSI